MPDRPADPVPAEPAGHAGPAVPADRTRTVPGAAPAPPGGTRRPLSRRKRWAFRAAALLLVLLGFAAAEGVLRLAGYGVDTRLVAPVSGAPPVLGHRLNERIDHAYYGIRDLAGPEPRRFQLPRPPGTFRVLVTGASTVIGYPYPPELAFPRQLELLLERQAPDLDVEVLNAGITAVNSFSVRDVVAQAASCVPDLIVVHSGHNEFYGPGGVASTSAALPPALIPWRYALRRLRLVQLGTDWALARQQTGSDLIASLPRTIEIPLDGELVRSAERAYRANLEQMVRSARAADIPLLLTTVASNLRDQSPIRSLEPDPLGAAARREWREHFDEATAHADAGRWSEAVEAFARAAEVYDGHALAAYRRAQCLERLFRHEEALAAYVRARDLDACRFRAPSSFGRIVREVAGPGGAGVHFLDLAAEVEAQSGPTAPGFDLFVEHVHYRLDGHYQLARLLARFIVTDVLARTWDESRVPPFEEMRELLGAIPEDDLVAYSFALQTLQTPPLDGAADSGDHQQQLRDWIARIYYSLEPIEQEIFGAISMQDLQADLLGALAERSARRGLPDRAAALAELAARRQPWSADRQLALAEALLAAGERSRAREPLDHALQLRPAWPAAEALRGRLSGRHPTR